MIMNYDAKEILKNELKELPDYKAEFYEETFQAIIRAMEKYAELKISELCLAEQS